VTTTKRKATQELAILILIGGKSERFKSDKGLFEFLGKPLISYQLDILSKLDYNIFLVANSKKQVQNYINKIDINKSYFEVDGVGWRSPTHISIKSAMDLMELDIPPEANVKLVTFDDQDTSINRPPSTYSLSNNLHLSVDENFLYVWVNERWKRIPLSNF